MTIRTKQITGIAYLVSLRGGPERGQSDSLVDRLEEIIAAGGREIVVDLGEATAIDHGMLETLLEAAGALDARGGELLVARKRTGRDAYRLSRVRHGDFERLLVCVSAS